MALFDIVNEITEKQVTKTETGDERIFGTVLGIVTENYKKEMPGMVQVQIPVRDEENAVFRWAKTAHMYSGKKWGQYFQPEIGDQVLLVFEHGNIERPFIIGSVPRDNDTFISQSSKEKNEVKRITTKHGNELYMKDARDGDGGKDQIKLETSGKKQSVSLENEKGQIVIRAEKKLTIQVGDSIKITMNGDNGTVTIDADKVKIQASNMMEFKSDGTAKFSGQQTMVEASSVLKLNSSGMASVQGSPIKLG